MHSLLFDKLKPHGGDSSIKGGDTMKNDHCVVEKTFQYGIGLMLLILSVAVGGVIFLFFPVIGIVWILPILALAVYVFRLRLNDQCEIDPG